MFLIGRRAAPAAMRRIFVDDLARRRRRPRRRRDDDPGQNCLRGLAGLSRRQKNIGHFLKHSLVHFGPILLQLYRARVIGQRFAIAFGAGQRLAAQIMVIGDARGFGDQLVEDGHDFRVIAERAPGSRHD